MAYALIIKVISSKRQHTNIYMSGTEKERGEGMGGGGGAACPGGYKRVQAVRPGSVVGGWCYCVMEFGSHERNMCSFQMKKIWRNLDGLPGGEKEAA